MEEKKEMVNHPSHYCQGNMECIDGLIGAFGRKEVATFCKINAMKYIWRLGHKDDEAQEIGKIKWYLDNKPWWENIISGEYKEYYKKMYDNR